MRTIFSDEMLDDIRDWVFDNKHYSIHLSIITCLIFKLIQLMMKDRKPFHMRGTLLFFNGSLSLLYALAIKDMTPDLVRVVAESGLRNSYCKIDSSFFEGTTGFWLLVFCITRYVEFLDILFLILQKKKVHLIAFWFHHPYSFVWIVFGYPYDISLSRWLPYQAFLVHCFIYARYVLVSLHLFRPYILLRIRNSLILVQFSFSTLICLDCFIQSYFFNDCHVFPSTALVLTMTYAAFIPILLRGPSAF